MWINTFNNGTCAYGNTAKQTVIGTRVFVFQFFAIIITQPVYQWDEMIKQ